MRGGCQGHHTQAHSLKSSGRLSAPGGPRSPGAPLPRRRHEHTRLPHVHSQCLQELLGIQLASATDWLPTAQFRGLAVAPDSSYQRASRLCGPTQSWCPQESGSGPSGHPGARQPTVPPVGQKLGSSNSLSGTVLYNLASPPLAWQKTQPPPTSEGPEVEGARTPGNWAGPGGATG